MAESLFINRLCFASNLSFVDKDFEKIKITIVDFFHKKK